MPPEASKRLLDNNFPRRLEADDEFTRCLEVVLQYQYLVRAITCDAFERAATLMRMPDEAPPFPFFVVEDDP